jgi:hypothetical protein
VRYQAALRPDIIFILNCGDRNTMKNKRKQAIWAENYNSESEIFKLKATAIRNNVKAINPTSNILFTSIEQLLS